MTIRKKGHGVVAHVAMPDSARRATGLAGPTKPGTVFPRPDKPFFGHGTRVSLARAEGYTPQGKLVVPFRFQMPPTEAITRTVAHTWTNFDVLDEKTRASERSRSGGRRLRGVSINTFFMLETALNADGDEVEYMPPSGAVWTPGPGLMNPILAARELEQLVLEGVRFRLRIYNANMFHQHDVDMIAVCTSAPVTEQPGEPDTRYLQMDFQEYLPTQVEREAIHNNVGPWTHTIKDGDTLYKLARHYYKAGSQWKRIALANKGMEHQPPSHNLIGWRKKHHRKTIRIPQAVNARTPVSV